MLRGLSQPQVATIIDVDTGTVLNWEKSRTEPPVTSFPSILQFLGYDPYPEAKTLGERLFAKRRMMGWTIKDAAQQIGVDEGTWGQWERSGHISWQRYTTLLEDFLKKS